MKLNKHYLSMLHSCPKLVSCMLFAIKFILKSQDDTSETLVLFSLGLSVLTTAAWVQTGNRQPAEPKLHCLAILDNVCQPLTLNEVESTTPLTLQKKSPDPQVIKHPGTPVNSNCMYVKTPNGSGACAGLAKGKTVIYP